MSFSLLITLLTVRCLIALTTCTIDTKSRFGQYATEVYFGTRATVCQACASSPYDNVFDINYRDCNKIYYLPSPAYQFKVLGSSNKFGFTELLYAYIMSTDIKY